MPTAYVAQSPAAAWIKGDDVSGDDRLTAYLDKFGVGGVFGLALDDVAQMATDILFYLTGQRFLGTIDRVVRPHRLLRERRGLAAPIGWGYAYSGAYGQFSRWFPEGWPDAQRTQFVTLDGPNTVVHTVTIFDPAQGISGVMPTADWTLRGRDLWRMADPGGAPLPWPANQRLDLPLGEPYTWSVDYSFGQPPDWAGIMAVRDFTVELAASIASGKSRIPGRVTSITQHGTTVALENSAYMQDGLTGLPLVDQWIVSVNPHRLRRRPAILTPQSVVPSQGA